MILIIDNYDSFTYNLAQLIGALRKKVLVFRNDEITLSAIEEMRPEGIVISPGPGRPESAGISVDVVHRLKSAIPILGVCLGHQAIGVAFGAEVIHGPRVMHGKLSQVFHDGQTIFRGLDNPFPAARYHSLIVSPRKLPTNLLVSARSEDNVIMGIRHREFPVEGVQFHPESFMTTAGVKLVRNWLRKAKEKKQQTSGEIS